MPSKFRKTKYIAPTVATYTEQKWQRVYEDEDGKYYIKKDGEWRCIENAPCRADIMEGSPKDGFRW